MCNMRKNLLIKVKLLRDLWFFKWLKKHGNKRCKMVKLKTFIKFIQQLAHGLMSNLLPTKEYNIYMCVYIFMYIYYAHMWIYTRLVCFQITEECHILWYNICSCFYKHYYHDCIIFRKFKIWLWSLGRSSWSFKFIMCWKNGTYYFSFVSN